MNTAPTKNTTVTLYRITASLDRDGQCLDMGQAEVLGEAHGKIYTKKAEAEAMAEDMAADLESVGLDPATEYHVKEVVAAISDIDTTEDDDGTTIVTAHVRVDGIYDAPTAWYAVPRICGLGADGLTPAGDSLDCWTDADLAAAVPTSALLAIGEATIARAGRR